MKAFGRCRRGFSLLLAVSLVAVLSLGAAALLLRAGDLGALTGASARGAKSLAAAQDGAQWGLDAVNQMVFASDTASITFTQLAALPALASDDPLCPDGAPCGRFLLLASNQSVGADGGTARVAVTCNPGGCTGSPNNLVNFQLRSLGRLPSGESRLVEMIVAPNAQH